MKRPRIQIMIYSYHDIFRILPNKFCYEIDDMIYDTMSYCFGTKTT